MRMLDKSKSRESIAQLSKQLQQPAHVQAKTTTCHNVGKRLDLPICKGARLDVYNNSIPVAEDTQHYQFLIHFILMSLNFVDSVCHLT